MPKETERIFRLLEKYLKDNGLPMNDENVKRFMEDYNAHLSQYQEPQDDIDRSNERYEMALDSKKKGEKRALLQEALELWPDNLDAFTELVRVNSKTPAEALSRLLEKEREWDKRYHDEGLLPKEEGDFYFINETRPYMRLLLDIFTHYRFTQEFDKAIAMGEKIIRLNRNDNLGVRFQLSGLYLLTDNEKGFAALWKKYRSIDNPFYHADKYIQAVLKGNKSLITRYMNELYYSNLALYLFFIERRLDYLDFIISEDSYQAGSLEEAFVYIDEHAELLRRKEIESMPVSTVGPQELFLNLESTLGLLVANYYAVQSGREEFKKSQVITYLQGTSPDLIRELQPTYGLCDGMRKNEVFNLIIKPLEEMGYLRLLDNGNYYLTPRGRVAVVYLTIHADEMDPSGDSHLPKA